MMTAARQPSTSSAPCAKCGVPTPNPTRMGRSRLRCAGCKGIHARSGAAISPSTPWLEDYAARALVVHHPDGMDRESVAATLGITSERVRQIEVDAIRKLAVECIVSAVSLGDLLATLEVHHALDGEAGMEGERTQPIAVPGAAVAAREDDEPSPTDRLEALARELEERAAWLDEVTARAATLAVRRAA